MSVDDLVVFASTLLVGGVVLVWGSWALDPGPGVLVTCLVVAVVLPVVAVAVIAKAMQLSRR